MILEDTLDKKYGIARLINGWSQKIGFRKYHKNMSRGRKLVTWSNVVI